MIVRVVVVVVVHCSYARFPGHFYGLVQIPAPVVVPVLAPFDAETGWAWQEPNLPHVRVRQHGLPASHHEHSFFTSTFLMAEVAWLFTAFAQTY